MTRLLSDPQTIRSLVDRIESIEAQINDFNSDKSDIYAEAKGQGFDVKALKAVIAYRRKDPTEAANLSAVFDTYMHALQSGTVLEEKKNARLHEENQRLHSVS